MKGQKGFTLIEVLVAMAIIGITATGIIGAMTASTKTAVTVDRVDTARALAQAQMEYVKKQAFSAGGNYLQDEGIMAEYPGYTVDIAAPAAAQRDSYIQKITVTITHNEAAVYTLQDCKVKR